MKKALWAVWIIVILIIANLTTLYFLYHCHSTKKPFVFTDLKSVNIPITEGEYFHQPIDEPVAIGNVNVFRQYPSFYSRGIIYDSATIRGYLDTVYPRIKNNISKGSYADYVWKVGFYWMFTKQKDSTSRLAFCVLPTLVGRASNKVADYFNDSLHLYKHPALSPAGTNRNTPVATGRGNAYDEGQLWP